MDTSSHCYALCKQFLGTFKKASAGIQTKKLHSCLTCLTLFLAYHLDHTPWPGEYGWKVYNGIEVSYQLISIINDNFWLLVLLRWEETYFYFKTLSFEVEMVIFMLLDEVLSAVVVVQNRGVVFQQGKDVLCCVWGTWWWVMGWCSQWSKLCTGTDSAHSPVMLQCYWWVQVMWFCHNLWIIRCLWRVLKAELYSTVKILTEWSWESRCWRR